MKDTAPQRGAGADDPHRGNGSVAGIARWVTLGRVIVRTGSSYANVIQFSARVTTGSTRSQRSRGLDSAERSPKGDPEARGSGKSDGKRSDRSETTGGRGGELSAGWREVAEQLHAEEGTGHE